MGVFTKHIFTLTTEVDFVNIILVLYTKQRRPRQLSKLKIIAIVVIIVLALLGISEVFGWSHIIRKDTPPQNTNTQQTPTRETKTSDKKTEKPSSSSDKSTDNTTPTAETKPVRAPSGEFVSNHSPNLDGSPAPNLMSSVCSTTPGIQCSIRFSKDGVTKSLPAKITDTNGAAYWTWRLQDIGLTAGSWKITAVAKSGATTKTFSDPLNLKVGN